MMTNGAEISILRYWLCLEEFEMITQYKISYSSPMLLVSTVTNDVWDIAISGFGLRLAGLEYVKQVANMIERSYDKAV